MKFTSTRDTSLELSGPEAIVQGLSREGGLFVPTEFPELVLDDFLGLDYEALAAKIVGLYLPEFSADEVAGFVQAAYSDALPVALHHLTDGESVLELFHGHTSAFKDVALQLLPYLMTASLKAGGESRKAVILAATSGDTGSAVMSGFSGVPQTEVITFFPDSGISEIQRLQMTTQTAANVHAVAIKGNFDDAQRAVKEIFQDAAFVIKFDTKSFFTSANSINFGRLLPQIVYYFWTYSELVKSDKIQKGDKVNYTVPTGNFGNILAGYYAKKMGLPVGHLICATNKNSVLFDFFETGVYDRAREFYVTNSPSMDILVSSNFERFVYHMGGSRLVKETQAALANDGRYTVPEAVFTQMKETFSSYTLDDAATTALIDDVFDNFNYILDPHTAVAYGACEYYKAESQDSTYNVVLATASPYKFPATVEAATGKALDDAQIPENLKDLTKRTVTQTQVIEKSAIRATIEEILSHD